jgi:hypothetical protein
MILANKGKFAVVYLDSNGIDYKGLSLVAESFAKDINMVTGATPTIVTDAARLRGTAIIAGSIGNNAIIDFMIASGKIDVASILNKWECFKIQVVKNPVAGVDEALVIVGSDKRGTIYGIYHISELIGVSPWVYWGDVKPVVKSELIFSESDLNKTSREPSVKYRGIFLNDEWPSLGSWVTKKFGGFNEEFYDEVFKLILRLKGNYLWPAMWACVFSEEGQSSPIACAELADAYGIVMGTSHHEPICRAGEEWKRIYSNYATNNSWDFSKNEKAITRFWEDGIARNKDYGNLITIGMRGEQDSALEGSDEDNINLLKKIITAQKGLLKKQGLEKAPQILALYKEVEQFWYGTDTVAGLKDWNVLDDVIIMLAEDNFGNVRTLPPKEQKHRKAGWGMYYHFDYHGGPVSYEWVNSMPLAKTWEQMSMAYEYGVKRVWIVNVGDLKPMELPTSYFLDLAYDFDTWGTNGINKTMEYTRRWVEQQFGSVVNKADIDGIADVLTNYSRMNGDHKPEVTYSDTYNCSEWKKVLAKAVKLENDAKKYYEILPEDYKDTYYQLVYYPAVASANVVKMNIYAGMNQRYYSQKNNLANTCAKLVEECIKADSEMQEYYNKAMSGGKWEGIMSSAHIGYKSWNADGWEYPQIRSIVPEKDSSMIVNFEGVENTCCSEEASLPEFTNLGKESYSISIGNGGSKEFNYTVKASEDWIVVDSTQGSITSGKIIHVTLDWNRVLKTSSGFITITGAGAEVQVNVTVKVIDTQGLPEMTFVKMHDLVSIEAEHFTKTVSKSGVEWKVIENYGRSLSSLKMFPVVVSFQKPEDAPYIEYNIYVEEEDEYMLTSYTAPTNNLSTDSRLRYAVAFDNENPIIADALPNDYIAGDYNNTAWCNAVLENIHIANTKHCLTRGVHTLRFYGIDAGLVLQKLVLSNKTLPTSYFGPDESYYTGSTE